MANIPNTLNTNTTTLAEAAANANTKIDNAVDAILNDGVIQAIDQRLMELDKEINKLMALMPAIACTSALLQFPMGKTSSLTDPRGFAPGISATMAGVVGQIRNYENEYQQFKEKLLTLADSLKQIINNAIKAAETIQKAFDTIQKVVSMVQGAFGGTPISKEEIIDKLCAFSQADLNSIPADSVLRKIDTFKQMSESFKDVTFAVTAVGGGFALKGGGGGGGGEGAIVGGGALTFSLKTTSAGFMKNISINGNTLAWSENPKRNWTGDGEVNAELRGKLKRTGEDKNIGYVNTGMTQTGELVNLPGKGRFDAPLQSGDTISMYLKQYPSGGGKSGTFDVKVT